MKNIFTGAAVLVIAAVNTPALANDTSFSGPYVGINAGYVLGSTTVDDYDCAMACTSLSLSPQGASVGGTLGYNHRAGALVLGIEGDFDVAFAKKNLAFDWDGSQSHHDTRINSYGTIRGRAGVVADKALLFVTAGLGIVDQHTVGYNPSEDSGNNYAFDDHAAKFGAALGAGVEYKLSDKVSAKLEYLSIKTATRNAIPDIGNNCSGETYCAYGVRNGMDTVRVGVNYAF